MINYYPFDTSSITTGSTFKISAPGKVILNGEHSVVYGKLAIAASIDLRTTFEITEINIPDVLIIQCRTLKFVYKYNLMDIENFLLNVPLPLLMDDKDYNLEYPQYLDHDNLLNRVDKFLKRFHQIDLIENHLVSLKSIFYLLTGIIGTTDLHLTPIFMDCSTDLNTGSGLGSSASFAVATAASLVHYVKSKSSNLSKSRYKTSEWDFDLTGFTDRELSFICRWGFSVEKIIHGTPSGLDNTICTYGAVVEYRKGASPIKVKMHRALNLLLINSNVPRETKRLVMKVGERRKRFPLILDHILDAMDAVSKTVLEKMEQLCTLTSLDDAMDVYNDLADIWFMNQSLLDAIGVGHKELTKIIQILSNYNLSAKLTGAGGGGYAICLIPPKFDSDMLKKAVAELETHGFDVINTNFGVEGVRLDKKI
ncbi:mevalonate kinase isoform X1 [Diorhabda carinulata]|uniref:mevalonate kinase isoform X1 n=2 Tax=Diorhabda carinulata TaxID=1163345 RepID=UPI0025A124AC|nr:mevalonate kinase isoform X1 [Diorhabda carinulata]